VGFDLLLVFALVRTAYMAFKVDARIQLTATAAATLLIVDAWFDVTTSHGHAAVAEALVLAVFAEIPSPSSASSWPAGWAPTSSSWPTSSG